MATTPSGEFFRSVDERGCLVELRYAPTWWLTDLARTDRPVLFDQDAPDGAGGDDGWEIIDDEVDGSGCAGELLCAVDDEVVNPVWWVSEPGGRGAPATLSEALRDLCDGDRSDAVAAHLRVLGEIALHEQAAADGAEGTGCDPVCAACIAEPEVHAMVLYDAIVLRARELTEALALYSLTVAVLPDPGRPGEP
jgi:hypothetical protein